MISQTPASGPTTVSAPTGDLIERRWTFSDFKLQAGLRWPRRILESGEDGWNEEISLSTIRINPRLDAHRFNIR